MRDRTTLATGYGRTPFFCEVSVTSQSTWTDRPVAPLRDYDLPGRGTGVILRCLRRQHRRSNWHSSGPGAKAALLLVAHWFALFGGVYLALGVSCFLGVKFIGEYPSDASQLSPRHVPISKRRSTTVPPSRFSQPIRRIVEQSEGLL